MMTSCVAIAQLSAGRKTFKQGYVCGGWTRTCARARRVRASTAWPREHLGPSSGDFQGAGTREKVTAGPELIPARLRSSAAFMDFPG